MAGDSTEGQPAATLRTFLLSSGRLYGRRLKTTAVAAIDLHTNHSWPSWAWRCRACSIEAGRRPVPLPGLSAPFKTGGATASSRRSPKKSRKLRVLNECELDDRAGRLRISTDPEYGACLPPMWHKGKRGFNLANLKAPAGPVRTMC